MRVLGGWSKLTYQILIHCILYQRQEQLMAVTQEVPQIQASSLCHYEGGSHSLRQTPSSGLFLLRATELAPSPVQFCTTGGESPCCCEFGG